MAPIDAKQKIKKNNECNEKKKERRKVGNRKRKKTKRWKENFERNLKKLTRKN